MHRWGFAYLFIRCGPSAGLRRVNKVTRKTRPYTNPQSKKRSFSEKVTDRLSKELDRGSATKNVNERTTSPIRVIYLPTDRPSDGHTLLEPLCERLKCIFSQTVCLRVCICVSGIVPSPDASCVVKYMMVVCSLFRPSSVIGFVFR